MIDANAVVGLVGASVVVLGYAITQASNRLEARRRSYADALAALNALMELPYWIARRTEDSPGVRQRLADRTREVQQDLSYALMVLDLDSAAVRKSFRSLVVKTRTEGLQHRKRAWLLPTLQRDAEMGTDLSFPYSNSEEFENCLSAMLRELSIYRALLPRRR